MLKFEQGIGMFENKNRKLVNKTH